MTKETATTQPASKPPQEPNTILLNYKPKISNIGEMKPRENTLKEYKFVYNIEGPTRF